MHRMLIITLSTYAPTSKKLDLKLTSVIGPVVVRYARDKVGGVGKGLHHPM